jgi:hypothetical protein
MKQNGIDREASNTERLIALVARLNDAIVEFMALLRELLAGQRVSSERLARLESVVEKVYELAIKLSHNVDEARDDIDKVREETNPRFRVLDPTDYPLRKKDDSGKVLAIDSKRTTLPTAWLVWLLKLGLPFVVGVGSLRLKQWLETGH